MEESLLNRYDKDYTYGRITFHLKDYTPDEEQCRFLILKVLEQAVRDYVSLASSEVPNDKALYETARDFLYDDDYTIWWGDKEMTTEQLMEIVDLDMDWVREQATKKFKEGKI